MRYEIPIFLAHSAILTSYYTLIECVFTIAFYEEAYPYFPANHHDKPIIGPE